MDRILSRFQPVSPRQLLHSDYLSHVDVLYTVQRYWDLHSVHFHPEHWSSQWNDWICVEQHCLFSTFHSCTSLSLEPGNMGTRIYCFRWKRYLLSECSWQSHENYRFRILFCCRLILIWLMFAVLRWAMISVLLPPSGLPKQNDFDSPVPHLRMLSNYQHRLGQSIWPSYDVELLRHRAHWYAPFRFGLNVEKALLYLVHEFFVRLQELYACGLV